MAALPDLNHRRDFIVNCLYFAFILALVYVVCKYFISMIWPFFLAFLFAWILQPLIRLMTKKLHFRYEFAAAIGLIVLFAVMGGLLILLSARLVTAATELVSSVPRLYTNTIEPALDNLSENLEDLVNRVSPGAYSLIENAFPDIIGSIGSAVTEVAGKVAGAVVSFTTSLPRRVLTTIICAIATVFATLAFPSATKGMLRQLNARTRIIVTESAQRLVSVLTKYGRSYLLIMCITFTEVLVGLLIIRQEKPALIAFLVALFDIFPIVGAGMILMPWGVITLITGNIGHGIGILIIWIVVVVFRQYLEPKVVGKHVGLHPLITLIAMYVGNRLFGGFGLLGLPIACAIIKSLHDGGIIHILRTEEDELSSGTDSEFDA